MIPFFKSNRKFSRWVFISKGFSNSKEVVQFIETVQPNIDSPLINSGKTQVGDNDFNSNLVNDLIIQECDIAKKEYFVIVEDIHTLLKNSKELSNNEKLVYCNSERFYMKQYLKHVLIKVNRNFPD